MSNVNRILNLQSELHDIFPALKNAYTIAMAQAAIEIIDGSADVDPFVDLQAKFRVLAPNGHVPVSSLQLAALIVIEQDQAWRILHREVGW